jgi:hypothetical protein
MNFLIVFLHLYLFFLCRNIFSRISENGKGLTRGTHRTATASPGVAPRLVVMGGTACHHACAGIKPCPNNAGLSRSDSPVRTSLGPVAPPLLRPSELAAPSLFLLPPLPHPSPFLAQVSTGSPSPPPRRLPPSSPLLCSELVSPTVSHTCVSRHRDATSDLPPPEPA